MPLSTLQIVCLAAIGTALTIAAIGIGVGLAPHDNHGNGPSSLTGNDDGSTLMLSDVPSAVPSFAPSLRPTTARPTITPMPTTFPSDIPSSSPTRQPIDPNFSFRLELHWELEFMWQNETTERHFCLECVRCDPISMTEFGPQDGCYDNETSVTDCYLHDQLWLQNCGTDKGNAQFQIIPGANDGSGDQIKIKDTDLCIERTGNNKRLMFLGTCNSTVLEQKWQGFDMDAPFDWRPSGHDDFCVSQHHHPKPGEVVYAETCYLAYTYDTALWDAI